MRLSMTRQGSMVTIPPSRLQVPPSEKTPAWCGPEALKDKAGPKSWRGAGPALGDWGELNTGDRGCRVWMVK